MPVKSKRVRNVYVPGKFNYGPYWVAVRLVRLPNGKFKVLKNGYIKRDVVVGPAKAYAL